MSNAIGLLTIVVSGVPIGFGALGLFLGRDYDDKHASTRCLCIGGLLLSVGIILTGVPA